MKLKVFLLTLILLLLFNAISLASIVNVDISLSNYGYGTGIRSAGRQGLTFYLTYNMKGQHSYTRTGLRYYTKVNKRSYYGSLGYVSHTYQQKSYSSQDFDIGAGIEFDLAQRSAFNIEGGYSSAVSEKFYYLLSLKINWDGPGNRGLFRW